MKVSVVAHALFLEKAYRSRNEVILSQTEVEIWWEFGGDSGEDYEPAVAVMCSPRIAHVLLKRFGTITNLAEHYGCYTDPYDESRTESIAYFQYNQKCGCVSITLIASIDEIVSFLTEKFGISVA